MKYMIKFPQRIYCTLYTQCIQDMSHIVYLFSLLSYLQKNATIQSIHRLFCVSASHRHVSYPTSCYGRSQAENVELHGWPSHQRRLTGREQRHLGGFRDDEIILLWDFPILELFFCQKSLSDSWYSYLGINIWEILIYIYIVRDLYTQIKEPVWRNGIFVLFCVFSWLSLGEADWKLILLRADIGIFLLMVWKLILLIFRSAGYFLFRETRPAMTRSFVCCEMLCAKGTMFLKMIFKSCWMRKLIQKKSMNSARMWGSLHPLNSWKLGALDSTTS